MADDFLASEEWKRKRAAILRRDGYIDKYLFRYGKKVPGNTVHHIAPRELFPEYKLADWNLMTMNEKTHNGMHDRTTNKLTAEGFELLTRTFRKNNIAFDERVDQLRPREPAPRSWRSRRGNDRGQWGCF